MVGLSKSARRLAALKQNDPERYDAWLAKQRARQQTPEYKARKKAHRDKNKERAKALRRRPEAKARTNANQKRRRTTAYGRVEALAVSAHFRARQKNLPFELDRAWRLENADKLCGDCPMCGTPFDAGPPPVGRARNPAAPTLDQVVPRAGYSRVNTAIVCNNCNMGKGEMSLDEYLAHCRKVAEKNVSKVDT